MSDINEQSGRFPEWYTGESKFMIKTKVKKLEAENALLKAEIDRLNRAIAETFAMTDRALALARAAVNASEEFKDQLLNSIGVKA